MQTAALLNVLLLKSTDDSENIYFAPPAMEMLPQITIFHILARPTADRRVTSWQEKNRPKSTNLPLAIMKQNIRLFILLATLDRRVSVHEFTLCQIIYAPTFHSRLQKEV